MSRSGNCFESGVIGNFSGRLKEELCGHVRHLTVPATALLGCIRCCNKDSTAAKRKGPGPVQYRTRALVAQAPGWPVQQMWTVHRAAPLFRDRST